MNKVILFEQDTGTVAVLKPVYLHDSVNGLPGVPMTESEREKRLDHCIKNDIPKINGVPVQYSVIDESDVPAERTFRDAWKMKADKSGIETDITKAKEIAHTKRRARREALFKPLDTEATIPAKASQAEAARQAIRDADSGVQNSINAATTEAQLKQILADYNAL